MTFTEAAEKILLLRDCAAVWALSKESATASYVCVDNLVVITSSPRDSGGGAATVCGCS